ncbi:MAG TPA: LacI family DNA-binding transcriptional regulator [Microlunatus sp.]|nr:LacI family DNA-binding transcriptional regulator [Microlunatus sp.]
MRATVRDVANRARVSPKTVSNVVNGTVPVSPATRLRVEQAIAELDYVPNFSARGLRNGRSGVIALALPNLDTAYSSEMAHFVVQAATARGLSVQIEETHGGAEGERRLLSRARAQLVDGLILNPTRLETSAVQPDVQLPPVVLIGEVDQPIADHVWIDNVAASREIVDVLLREGHRRIALLGRLDSESSRLRVLGYDQALVGAGAVTDPDLIIEAEWNPRGGALALAHWLESHEPPEAIFCLTDSMALGALNALWAAGLRVPDDVSLVGYDDIAEAAYLTPPLTTVSFDKRQFAETALGLLVDRIADPHAQTRTITVPHRVVERLSVRRR